MTHCSWAACLVEGAGEGDPSSLAPVPAEGAASHTCALPLLLLLQLLLAAACGELAVRGSSAPGAYAAAVAHVTCPWGSSRAPCGHHPHRPWQAAACWVAWSHKGLHEARLDHHCSLWGSPLQKTMERAINVLPDVFTLLYL